MPPSAILITDNRIAPAPWLRDGPNGTIGQRNWLVNTHDEEAALSFVPAAYNSPWSPARPDLLLVEMGTRYWARKDGSDDPPTGGLTVVQCDYATPRTGSLAPPALALKYTDLEFGEESVNLKFDVRSLTAAVGPWAPINNGEGVGRSVGMIRAKVTTYISASDPVSISRIIGLARRKAVNNAPLTLPAIYGTATTFLMGAGQVRYDGIDRPEVTRGLTRVVHNLSLAEDWYFRWSLENADGSAAGGSPQVSWVYEQADLSGLW